MTIKTQAPDTPAGPATHRFLAQWVRVTEETPDGCSVVFEDGSGSGRLFPRNELVSLSVIEVDQNS